MIKTLLFDNNGVFTANDLEGSYQKLADFFGVTVAELQPIQDYISKAEDVGKITTDQFYDYIQEQLGTNKSKVELRKVHLSSYEVRPEVKDFVKTLSNRYELAMLTNFGDGFDEANQKYWRLEDVFKPENIFVSYKVGMLKPNEDFYLYALNKLKKEPREVIFIDDKIENVETARTLGMNAVQFKTIEQLKAELSEITERNNEK